MRISLQVKDKSETSNAIEVTQFKRGIRKTEPHKHDNYFEIIYLSRGSGYHSIDYDIYTIEAPIVFFVRREQVHYWELQSEPEGYVLILRKEFIAASFDNELKRLFAQVSGVSNLQVKDNETIDAVFSLLMKESIEKSVNSSPIIEGLLKVLLAKVLSVANPSLKKSKGKPGLFQSFREILIQNSIIRNNIAYFADLLHTTPQNLNAACRKAVNQSASEVLAEHIISEAKRLLLYTDNTVSEISFALEFTDSSHFVKYFKRYTGHTPHTFRNL